MSWTVLLKCLWWVIFKAFRRFFLCVYLRGLAVKDFHILHLKPVQFWVGSKFLFVVLLEHFCPNLRSLALWMSICVYLVPSFLPCVCTSLLVPAAGARCSQHDAVTTCCRAGGRRAKSCALWLITISVLSIHLLLQTCHLPHDIKCKHIWWGFNIF